MALAPWLWPRCRGPVAVLVLRGPATAEAARPPHAPAPHPSVEGEVEVERLPQPCHHHQPAAAVRRELMQRRPWAEGHHHRLRSHHTAVVQLGSEAQHRPPRPVGARAVGWTEEQLYQASHHPLRVS